MKWRVMRRIASIGLLWNSASDAWLGIPGLKTAERNAIFSVLLSENNIVPVNVEDLKYICYCSIKDTPLIDYIKEKPNLKKRCEFIAPLDNMLWDRKLIKEIFDFDYKWEIYTPKAKRKYGYYVLPILYGEQFIGRIEMAYDKKIRKLNVHNIWYEPGIKITKTIDEKIKKAIKRFENFSLE